MSPVFLLHLWFTYQIGTGSWPPFFLNRCFALILPPRNGLWRGLFLSCSNDGSLSNQKLCSAVGEGINKTDLEQRVQPQTRL